MLSPAGRSGINPQLAELIELKRQGIVEERSPRDTYWAFAIPDQLMFEDAASPRLQSRCMGDMRVYGEIRWYWGD